MYEGTSTHIYIHSRIRTSCSSVSSCTTTQSAALSKGQREMIEGYLSPCAFLKSDICVCVCGIVTLLLIEELPYSECHY